MATTISKINVYKNQAWESYPISTSAQYVLTEDGNLTNTISKITNIESQITDINTTLNDKISSSEDGSINGNLTVTGRLTTNRLTSNYSITGSSINAERQLYVEDSAYLNNNNIDSALYFSMNNGTAIIHAAGENTDTGDTVSNYIKLIGGFSNGEVTKNVQVSDPALWRKALSVEHLDTAETTSTNRDRYTRYMKFEDGSLICMVEVVWTGSITTTYGSMFYNDSVINGGNWPVAFTGVPYVSMTCARGGTAFVGPALDMSKTNIGTLYLYRPLQNTEQQQAYYIDIIGYGRWK